MRVVLITQVPAAAHGLDAMLRRLGHEPAALVCSRVGADRYGSRFDELVRGAPAGIDVVVPAGPARIAGLLRAFEPDLLLCVGFPWRIPEEALAVPRLGAVNGHASLLPRYRGPYPFAWAMRNGDTEIGMTFHRMDADFDTGPILAQGTVPLDDEDSIEALEPKLARVVSEVLPVALQRVERRDSGDPQPDDGASYAGPFEPEYARIDWSRSASEIHRQVRAWSCLPGAAGEAGPLGELDGRLVRVLRTRLSPGEGVGIECGEGTIWVVESEEVAAE